MHFDTPFSPLTLLSPRRLNPKLEDDCIQNGKKGMEMMSIS